MRRILSSAVLAAFVTIMSGPVQANDAAERVEMKKALDIFWTAVAESDIDGMVSVFAEDAVSQEPYGTPPLEGAAAIRQFFEGMSGAFQTISFTRGRLHVAGNRAAVAWSASGTMADGTAISFNGIDVVEFNDDGKIQRLWGYFEPLQMPGAG